MNLAIIGDDRSFLESFELKAGSVKIVFCSSYIRHDIFSKNTEIEKIDIDNFSYQQLPSFKSQNFERNSKIMFYCSSYFQFIKHCLERYELRPISSTELDVFFVSNLSWLIEKLSSQQITRVVFSNLPHTVESLSIFLAASYLGIEVLSFCITPYSQYSVLYRVCLKNGSLELELVEFKDLTHDQQKYLCVKNELLRVQQRKNGPKNLERLYQQLRFSSFIKKILFSHKLIYNLGYFFSILFLGRPVFDGYRSYIKFERPFLSPEKKWNFFNKLKFLEYKRHACHIKKHSRQIYKEISASKAFSVTSDMKYIYWPLQVEPEMTTLPQASEYRSMVKILNILQARLAETDLNIVIKEHPIQLNIAYGTADFSDRRSFYKYANSFSNVTFLPCDFNSLDLQENAAGVCVMTGNAGLEASLLGCPVVVFGEAWYKSFASVFDGKIEDEVSAFIEAVRANKKYDVNIEETTDKACNFLVNGYFPGDGEGMKFCNETFDFFKNS